MCPAACADVFNWLLIVTAYTAWTYDGHWRMVACVLCAVLNFCCMVLDCLDGMHARATRQTSKLGELLDHWLDAFHVPLVGAGVVYALGLQPWALAMVHVGNAGLYSAQLIHYYHTRTFIATSGVEAQISTSNHHNDRTRHRCGSIACKLTPSAVLYVCCVQPRAVCI
jgi:phosphatidylglycerophosphate synthase